ncbi:hypothetical protein N4562_03275 [Ligilactobacillus agilis]|uniref:Uncharacterized protein n=1 Tax=Ligilactobacillus agilis TaxID=1601 RepID=A0A9Q9J560_9LACO|nr:hypothetical protein [Ligilactobacillus agilis]UXC64075.1 hypothetical protein N4562_03275 [Ligilactobacillus agilis]UXC66075.1 hypothetical protein N4597_03275 [Ligilactobacillus agilis]
MENLEAARKLTDIAENLKALTGMMALIDISNSQVKNFFINATLSTVIDSLRNQTEAISSLRDELVVLDGEEE